MNDRLKPYTVPHSDFIKIIFKGFGSSSGYKKTPKFSLSLLLNRQYNVHYVL